MPTKNEFELEFIPGTGSDETPTEETPAAGNRENDKFYQEGLKIDRKLVLDFSFDKNHKSETEARDQAKQRAIERIRGLLSWYADGRTFTDEELDGFIHEIKGRKGIRKVTIGFRVMVCEILVYIGVDARVAASSQ